MPCSQSSANPSARPKTVSARRISDTVRGPACRAGCRPDPTTIRRPGSLSVVTGSRASIRPHNSISARVLGLVKRLVGALAHFGQGRVVAPPQCEPEAHGDRDVLVTRTGILEQFAQPVQVLLDIAGPKTRYGNAELFAADTADDALLAETFAQSGADPPQHLVSGQVAVHVVDLLEVVDVGQHQREGYILVPGQLECALGQVEEPRMVAERRQAVAVRKVLEASSLARGVRQQQEQHEKEHAGQHVHRRPETLALFFVLRFQFGHPSLFAQQFELLLGMLEIEFHLQVGNAARALHVQVFLAGLHARLIVLHGARILLPFAGDLSEHSMRFGQVVPGLALGEVVQYRRQQLDDPVGLVPGHFEPGEVQAGFGDAAFESGFLQPCKTRLQPRSGRLIRFCATQQVAQSALRYAGAQLVAGLHAVGDRRLVERTGGFDASIEFVDESELLLGVAQIAWISVLARLGQRELAEFTGPGQFADLRVRVGREPVQPRIVQIPVRLIKQFQAFTQIAESLFEAARDDCNVGPKTVNPDSLLGRQFTLQQRCNLVQPARQVTRKRQVARLQVTVLGVLLRACDIQMGAQLVEYLLRLPPRRGGVEFDGAVESFLEGVGTDAGTLGKREADGQPRASK